MAAGLRSLRFFMGGVLPAESAILLHLQPVRRLFLVLGGRIIPPLAFLASYLNDVPHLTPPFSLHLDPAPRPARPKTPGCVYSISPRSGLNR